MNGKEFSKLYAKSYGVNQKYAAVICSTVFELLGKVLYEDKEDVTFYGFGSFKQQIMAEKRARHPVSGEMIVIPERQVIKFRPSVNGGKEEAE